jgi:long-chain acyl-CoA synthetase
MIFSQAYSSKKEYLKQNIFHHSVWDRIVFNKIKERLGGRVKFMVCGAGI